MSLATELVKAAAPAQLPAVFTSGFEAFKQRFNTPYVSLAQPAAREQWNDFLQEFPNLEEGDPVLVLPNGEKHLLQPMTFFVLNYKQYFAVVDAVGNEISRHANDPGNGKERFWTALLVVHNGEIIPATSMFKTTKCPAATDIVNEIVKSTAPEWASKSDAHAQAVAACALPAFRVVGELTLTAKPARKQGARPYVLAHSKCRPSGPLEWALLSRLNADTPYLTDVASAWEARLKELAIK